MKSIANPEVRLRVGKSRRVAVGPMTFCLMVKLLQSQPHTYAELTEATGLHEDTLRKWIIEMRRQGLVRIGAWEPDIRGAPRVPAFVWGSGPDIKAIVFTRKELAARHRAKVKRHRIQQALTGKLDHVGPIAGGEQTAEDESHQTVEA